MDQPIKSHTLGFNDFNGPFLMKMWNDDSPESMQIVQKSLEWIVDRTVEARLITEEVFA